MTFSARILLPLLLLSTAPIPSRAAAPSKPLLVVAPAAFHDSLQPYLSHKRQFRPAELVSLEQILPKTPGIDDPERLKRYLYQQWRERSIGFVLLVGDIDVMPVRYMVLDRITPAAMDYAFYPSDLYYADLAKPDGTFETWNVQTDSSHASYFGEVRGEKNKQDPINYDAIDYLPEISVGRWPVSTPEEVRLIAEKSTCYENSASLTSSPKRNAAFVVVGGWVDCRSQVQTWADSMGPDWNVRKLFYSGEPKPADPQSLPTHQTVREIFNAGCSLVVHTGHGQADAWERCLNVADLDKITNTASLPIVMSAGCSTAYFAPLAPYGAYVDTTGHEHKGTDNGEVFTEPPPMAAPYQYGKFNPTGLGEQILKRNSNGAVVYIGCNTGSQPCALALAEGFVSAVQSKTTTAGECWNSAIRHYHKKQNLPGLKPDKGWYPPSIFFQAMKFMFFGDPSLPVR